MLLNAPSLYQPLCVRRAKFSVNFVTSPAPFLGRRPSNPIGEGSNPIGEARRIRGGPWRQPIGFEPSPDLGAPRSYSFRGSTCFDDAICLVREGLGVDGASGFGPRPGERSRRRSGGPGASQPARAMLSTERAQQLLWALTSEDASADIRDGPAPRRAGGGLGCPAQAGQASATGVGSGSGEAVPGLWGASANCVVRWGDDLVSRRSPCGAACCSALLARTHVALPRRSHVFSPPSSQELATHARAQELTLQ